MHTGKFCQGFSEKEVNRHRLQLVEVSRTGRSIWGRIRSEIPTGKPEGLPAVVEIL